MNYIYVCMCIYVYITYVLYDSEFIAEKLSRTRDIICYKVILVNKFGDLDFAPIISTKQ